jgi:hypothetical protein
VPILSNDSYYGNTTFNTENRLSIQDVFTATEIGVFVGVPSSSTATNWSLYNYVPPSIFTTSNSDTALVGLYNNGYLKFVNNQRVVAPFWDLKRHYNIPQTQIAANAGYTSSGVNTQAQVDGTSDGFYPVYPQWVFNGGGNIDMNVFLPQSLAAITANSRLVVMFRGFLLQNASQLK